LMNAALSKVAPADAADASGVVATVQQLSLVSGISLFGSLYLSVRGQSFLHPGAAAAWTMGLLVVAACLAAALSGRTWWPGLQRSREVAVEVAVAPVAQRAVERPAEVRA